MVTGLLRCGAKPEDEPAAKGIKFVEGLINTKAGHIAGPDEKALVYRGGETIEWRVVDK